jgi:hypothetical protein
MREAVERRLATGGLRLHSAWTFDVPESFDDVEPFYRALVWGHAPEELPSFPELRAELERLFAKHTGPEGVVMRHRRLLWKAVVDPAPAGEVA